ncbi:MAG: hypothetical protein JXA60_02565 [Candidatus Coatesbacteria bacterium]|nr:hypothetical protein [Candidatus Coatesbacteria bacterium]
MFKRYRECRLYDIEGTKWLSFSPFIPLLGYRNPVITKTFKNTLSLGNWDEKDPYLTHLKEWFRRRIEGYEICFYPSKSEAATLLFRAWAKIQGKSDCLVKLHLPLYPDDCSNLVWEDSLPAYNIDINQHFEAMKDRQYKSKLFLVDESLSFLRSNSLFVSLQYGFQPDLIWLDFYPSTGFPVVAVFKKNKIDFEIPSSNNPFFTPFLSSILKSLYEIQEMKQAEKTKKYFIYLADKYNIMIEWLGFLFRFERAIPKLSEYKIGEKYKLLWNESNNGWKSITNGHDKGSIDRLVWSYHSINKENF